jgi:predicted metalloprotease with PDZ domain
MMQQNESLGTDIVGSDYKPTIEYTLSFEHVGQHLIDVTLTFTAQAQQELWLPVWVPGSYLIREFSRHVSTLTAIASDQHYPASSRPISIEKITKNRWRLNCHDGERIAVHYQVYAYDLSVRGAYLDHTRAYANPACVCLAVAGQETLSTILTLQLGQTFAQLPIACSLTRYDAVPMTEEVMQKVAEKNNSIDQFFANNYDELIDHPFEIAEQSLASFDVLGIEHKIAISGRHRTNIPRLTADLERICRYEIEFFGEAPFQNYLFMVMATGSSYGGLEHRNCTSLITPREDLPHANEPLQPANAYRRFLGLCSHEYFHAWVVKFIRPQEFAILDLEREVYTRMLWVFEGFTSYYDDLILYRSGVIDRAAYLELLAEQITRYQQNTGKAHQSLSDSSFDAWIKYYRPDENSQNATTSYYNKGALIGLCLDLTLRARGSSLDALMRELFKLAKQGQYLQTQTIPDLCQQLVGDRLTDFWLNYVDGTVQLPIDEMLSAVGVQTTVEKKVWPLGLKTTEGTQGLMIQQVLRDSVGAKAGLSAHDTLIAIDGIRATTTLLAQWADNAGFNANLCAETGILLTCHVFRRDELMVFQLQPIASVMQTIRLTVANPEQLTHWLEPVNPI